MSEFTFADERQAHDERRKYISAGRSVSLIAFDPARGVYAFDVEAGDLDAVCASDEHWRALDRASGYPHW